MNKEKMKQELVDSGMIDCIKYFIVENGLYNPMNKQWGIWYCAYVVPPFCLQDKDPDEDINVYPHGGITWKGYLPVLKEDVYVWGWDYHHSMDSTWNDKNFLETKLQVLGRDRAIEVVRRDVEEYIGGLLNEISN